MNTTKEMNKKNQIGLKTDKTLTLVEHLNILLADYVVFYQNMRGLHWNIRGANFFELHEKFEEQYEKAHQYADDIAERILSLNGNPLHTLSEYSKATNLIEIYKVYEDSKAVEAAMLQMKTIINELRQIIKLAAEIEDEGTVDMLTEMIKGYEKDLWMFTAWSGNF